MTSDRYARRQAKRQEFREQNEERSAQIQKDAVNEASFEAGIEESLREYSQSAVYIDPDDVGKPGHGGITHRDASHVREEIEKQAPGTTDKKSNDELFDIAIDSGTKGPFANKDFFDPSKQLCLINKPSDSMNSNEEVVKILSGHDIKELKNIPGFEGVWSHIIGLHEGAHCVQDVAKGILGNNLAREIAADLEVIQWLEQQGLDDVAQAFKDYRAMMALSDPNHATSIFLENPELIPEDFDAEGLAEIDSYFITLLTLKDELNEVVADILGVSPDLADILFHDNKSAYVEALRQGVEEGRLENIEEIKMRYISAYIEAFDRQTVHSIEAEHTNGAEERRVENAGNQVMIEGIDETYAADAQVGNNKPPTLGGFT